MNFIPTPPVVLLVHFTQTNVVFAMQVGDVHMMPQLRTTCWRWEGTWLK
ncbi:MAG TPA: hypothetical protein VE735_01295 [Gammaproteobacteria bacterium]|nr:hypothetical protein [Gammaproteobacteria bacterium]